MKYIILSTILFLTISNPMNFDQTIPEIKLNLQRTKPTGKKNILEREQQEENNLKKKKEKKNNHNQLRVETFLEINIKPDEIIFIDLEKSVNDEYIELEAKLIKDIKAFKTLKKKIKKNPQEDSFTHLELSMNNIFKSFEEFNSYFEKIFENFNKKKISMKGFQSATTKYVETMVLIIQTMEGEPYFQGFSFELKKILIDNFFSTKSATIGSLTSLNLPEEDNQYMSNINQIWEILAKHIIKETKEREDIKIYEHLRKISCYLLLAAGISLASYCLYQHLLK